MRIQIDFSEAKLITKQSFRDECNINNIMAKYKRTGVIDHLASTPANFGDFDQAIDYQEASNRVIAADAAFAALPAHIRDRFQNEPAELLEFMADPANMEESIELGLRTQAPEPSTAADPITGAQPPDERGESPTPPSPAGPNPGGETPS